MWGKGSVQHLFTLRNTEVTLVILVFFSSRDSLLLQGRCVEGWVSIWRFHTTVLFSMSHLFFFYTAESGEAFPFEQRWWDISFLDCMSCYNFTIVPFLMAGKTWKHFFLPSSFSGFLCWEINRVHMLLSESSHAHALREAGLFSRHVNYILVELRV